MFFFGIAAIMALVSPIMALDVWLVNNCPEDMYWRSSSRPSGDVDQMSMLSAGQRLIVPKPPDALAVKMSKSGDWSDVLQAECTLDGSGLHYNWSDQDGDQYFGDQRGIFFNGAGGYQDLVCGPNSRSCDWSVDPNNIRTCGDPGVMYIQVC